MPPTRKKLSASDADSFREYLHLVFRHQGGRRAAFLRYTFYIYLGLVFLFGGFYYALFRLNPSAFAFTADILSAQATTYKLAARRDSATDELQIKLLRTLVDSLGPLPRERPLTRHSSPAGSQASVRIGGREYAISLPVSRIGISLPVTDIGLGAVESPGLLEIRQDAVVLTRVELPSGKLDVVPRTTGELHDQARQLMDYLQDQLNRSHELVLRLPTMVRPKWTYVDFVYFSAITQLTVGYGDILPNTTFVRLLVVLQSLLAVVMIVVVINLVVTGNPVSGPPATKSE